MKAADLRAKLDDYADDTELSLDLVTSWFGTSRAVERFRKIGHALEEEKKSPEGKLRALREAK
jgi:hypothetical protein